jgi:hypothetical protein
MIYEFYDLMLLGGELEDTHDFFYLLEEFLDLVGAYDTLIFHVYTIPIAAHALSLPRQTSVSRTQDRSWQVPLIPFLISAIPKTFPS